MIYNSIVGVMSFFAVLVKKIFLKTISEIKGVIYMFCPSCGKECLPTDKFCLSCGAKLTVDGPQVKNDPPVQQVQQQYAPVQNNAPIPPEQPIYDPLRQSSAPAPMAQPAAASRDVVDNYGGMYSQPAYAGAAGALSASPRKKAGIPKFLIIAVVAVIVVAIGIGVFLFVRNKMERDYLLNNPTKYVYSAAENYLDNSNSNSEFYSILKGMSDQGTFSAEVTGEVNKNGQSTPVSASAKAAYNKADKQAYYKIDGSGVMTYATGSPSDAIMEFYADPKRMDIAYNMMGQSGKYFIEPGKFREQAENSIFSPSKDNVLGVTQEQFNAFVDGFEGGYRTLMENTDGKELEEITDSIIEKFEKDADAKVESGSVSVNGKDYNTDIVTYTLDHAAIKSVMGDMRDEMVNYAKNHKDYFGGNSADAEKNITDGMNQAISAFDQYGNKNIKIQIKVYIDSSKRELVKIEIKLDNFIASSYNQSANHFEIIGEFTHDPDMNIKFTLTDGSSSITASVVKTVNGDVTRYNFDAGMTGSSARATASLEYNKSTKALTLIAGGVSLTGTLDITDDTATFGYDLPVPAETGKVHINIGISKKADINTIDADKNFFLITKDDFEQLVTSLGGAAGAGGIINNATRSSLEADAASLSSACKTYYAGIRSGTINSSSTDLYGNKLTSLPDKSASISVRRAAANSATIYDAMQYSGLTFDDDTLSKFALDQYNSIVPYESLNGTAVLYSLSSYTTLGELYDLNDY